MTDSERQQILKMIQDGKISAEQGLVLMQALDEAPEDEAPASDITEIKATQPKFVPADPIEKKDKIESGHQSDPAIDRKIRRFRRLWTIPLWVGVAIIVAGAYWMFAALQSAGWGFWFYLAWLPFLLGVLLTALAISSRNSRWIYINISQPPGETPRRIVLAFPVGLVRWILQAAKIFSLDQELGRADQVMSAIFESNQSSVPFFVDVNDEDGEHVQVYIG